MEFINQIVANWEHICAYAMVVVTFGTALMPIVEKAVKALDEIAKVTPWDWDDPKARWLVVQVEKLATFLERASAFIPRVTVGRR